MKKSYESLLRKFTEGTFVPAPKLQGMESVLLQAASAFRGGTVTEASKEYVRMKREEYRKEIASVREEIVKERRDALVNPKRKRKGEARERRRPGTRQLPDMTGRRVVVPSEYFHVEGDEYAGVVHEWGKFTSTDNKRRWGYHIHYALGDKWWMIEHEVARYLVREEGGGERENTVVVLEDEESVVDVNACMTVEEDEESNLYMGNGVRAEFLQSSDSE